LFRNAFRSLPTAIREPLKSLLKRVAFRVDKEGELSLEQAMGWLAALRDAGVSFGFPEDLSAGRGDAPLAILKHDIHQNLDRATAMALAERTNGIAGLFFMMGPHRLNRKFFGSAKSWDQLRGIQASGHRIGLHLDVMDAILRRGDLYEDIALQASRTRESSSTMPILMAIRRLESLAFAPAIFLSKRRVTSAFRRHRERLESV
jgi:hypothetical protein